MLYVNNLRDMDLDPVLADELQELSLERSVDTYKVWKYVQNFLYSRLDLQ